MQKRLFIENETIPFFNEVLRMHKGTVKLFFDLQIPEVIELLCSFMFRSQPAPCSQSTSPMTLDGEVLEQRRLMRSLIMDQKLFGPSKSVFISLPRITERRFCWCVQMSEVACRSVVS